MNFRRLPLPCLLALLLPLFFSGCITKDTPPFLEEPREVTTATSDTLYILLNRTMRYKDSDFDPLVGFRLKPGRYVLEAEDNDFWYFHAPKTIDVLLYDFGRIINGSEQPGGIMLSKTGMDKSRTVGVYIDGDNEHNKLLMRMLNNQMMKDRGTNWTLSTDQ